MESRKRIQLKPRLSIAKIGKFRFWIGIGLGILNAVIFYLFTFYLLDFMIVICVLLGGDLPSVPTEVSFFEKPFLIATSLTVGITMMIRHWFMQSTFNFQRSRKKITLRLSNFSLFLFYLVFYVTAVFIRFSYFDAASGETHRLINYNSFLFSIPLYLFFAAWTEVSRYFKTGTWIPYSFFISLFTIMLLSFAAIKPPKFAEIAFQTIYTEDFKYLNSELKRAKFLYQIEFNSEIIHTLKQVQSDELKELLTDVKNTFENEEKVLLKNIILQKILLHNFKGYHFEEYPNNNNYFYAYPIDVYRQLKKVAPTSVEAKELIDILYEYHELSLFDVEETYTEKLNKKDRQRNTRLYDPYSSYTAYNAPYRTIIRQIHDVKYGLVASKIYKHPLIDFITSDDFPPLVPPSLDVYQYIDEFPELEYKPK
jgi:hypothetical protein